MLCLLVLHVIPCETTALLVISLTVSEPHILLICNDVFKTVSNRDSLVLRLVNINWLYETQAGDLVITCMSGHAAQGPASAQNTNKESS